MKTGQDLFDTYLPQVESALVKYMPQPDSEDARSKLFSAMRYAVLDGGKRIRPVLLLEFCRISGGDTAQAMPFACALEMIHSYSLIHDDLPCMDDDALRRGKPSTHKAFGEATALLAGDGLLTYAFQTMLTFGAAAPNAMQAAGCLAAEAGCLGMVGGQMIDLASEGTKGTLDLLKKMDDGKTVALIRAACRMGCFLAGVQDLDRLSAADCYAENVGLAFQIQDDILDCEGDTALLGKKVGSDEKKQKATYASLLGLEKAKELVNSMTENAVLSLKKFGDKGEPLADLARMLGERRK